MKKITKKLMKEFNTKTEEILSSKCELIDSFDSFKVYKYSGIKNKVKFTLNLIHYYLYSIFCMYDNPTFISGSNCKNNFHLSGEVDEVIDAFKIHFNSCINECD